MIIANELRINNLVFDKFFNREGIVKYISPKRVILKMPLINLRTDYEGITGIPLTEEWILKFGFKQYEFITREYNLHDEFNFQAVNHYEEGFSLSCNFLIANIKCKYVHQLQNLYFALTGEELPLK